MSDKLTASSSMDPSTKTISVPVFHLYHKLLPGIKHYAVCLLSPISQEMDLLDSHSTGKVLVLNCILLFGTSGQPLPPEMTLAQLLALLYDRKLPQGYQSINLTVKLGSKVISDPGLSKTDSFKRLHTEKGTETCSRVFSLYYQTCTVEALKSVPVP